MKKLYRIVLGVICIIFIILIPILSQLNYKTILENDTKTVILSLWHIDTFEGGEGSRTSFLKEIANCFNKKNNKILINVVNHTINSAKELINKGVFPNLISYGVCDELITNYALEVDDYCNFGGGKVNNKNYAVSWCRGGYFLIKKQKSKETDNYIISCGENNNVFLSIYFNDLQIKNYQILEPTNAYQSFIISDNSYLIGTQRDIVKLEKRDIAFTATPLEKFNDLYSYISILKKENYDDSKKFISFLLSEDMQKKLTKIKMLSNKYENLYDDENFKNLERVKYEYTISPFITNDNINYLKQTGQNLVLNSDTSNIIKYLKQL